MAGNSNVYLRRSYCPNLEMIEKEKMMSINKIKAYWNTQFVSVKSSVSDAWDFPDNTRDFLTDIGLP